MTFAILSHQLIIINALFVSKNLKNQHHSCMISGSSPHLDPDVAGGRVQG